MPTVTKFQAAHPLKVKSGPYKGKLPHELPPEQFLGYLLVQGMTEDDYQHNVREGERFRKEMEANGKPIPTRHLTADQYGWAVHDHPANVDRSNGKWFVTPGMPRQLTPAIFELRRTREYPTKCECGNESGWIEWADRYDGRLLLECDICGSIVLDPSTDDE